MAKVLIEKQGNHIAIVKLNRPEKHNALDIELFDEIIAAAQQIEEDKEVRVAILTGNGPSFSAGLDTANFAIMAGQSVEESLLNRTHGNCNRWQKAVIVWTEISIPVITAGQGIIFGGGLQIFSAACIKYVHPQATLSILETKWGIIPDMGGSFIWPRTVREDILRELSYTHREFSGEQAVDYGFATHLSEQPLQDAITLAQEITKISPSATVKTKQLYNEVYDLEKDAALALESRLQADIMKQHNQIESVMSRMQKREPSFKGFRK